MLFVCFVVVGRYLTQITSGGDYENSLHLM